MVAAEAAACGCPPLVARHTRPRRGRRRARGRLPGRTSGTSRRSRPATSRELRAQLAELLALPAADRAALRQRARDAVVERWSWAGVAARLLAPVA